MTPHPCLGCGACCAAYRVGFYWREADDGGGTVPVAFTTPLDLHRRAMRGTDCSRPHCIALAGEIGVSVRCAIYDQRPSPCRDFTASWQHGRAEPRCDAARARYGLPPLTPGDWFGIVEDQPDHRLDQRKAAPRTPMAADETTPV